ncbi:hypothetical protein RHGRI_038680 [Rhododendron griersonianum]|uniref:Uncharacterized protein n=1 Tax=Rhododendron griersonianum TaxID=479676 RepID=A0AAV6HNP3_9ERIC|nr:hypothetical protein RHGRI_038680 [Rhododendron griersonianum]
MLKRSMKKVSRTRFASELEDDILVVESTELRGVERPRLFSVIQLMMDAIGPLELSLQAKIKHGCWMTRFSSHGDIGVKREPRWLFHWNHSYLQP